MTYEEILQTQPETPLYITLAVYIIPALLFVYTMYHFKKYNVQASPRHPARNKLGRFLLSVILASITLFLTSTTAYMFNKTFTAEWIGSSLSPFLEKNIEIKESKNININDYDYSKGEAEYTFVLDNGKTAHGTSDIKFDLKNGEKPFAKYRYNDEYIEHVPLKKRNELKMDGQKSSFYSFDNNNFLKDLKDDAYFGVYDVELHVPKDYIEKLPS